MHARVYVAVSYVADATTLHISHAGPFNVQGQLSILPECLSVHAWTWNPEVPATTVWLEP